MAERGLEGFTKVSFFGIIKPKTMINDTGTEGVVKFVYG